MARTHETMTTALTDLPDQAILHNRWRVLPLATVTILALTAPLRGGG